ncbi:MAG: cupin, partial [Lachnospiraceae bacterium]|nr:cupin [Lachnospiraceae bacterium]
MVRKADIVFKDNVRGGEGTIEFRHILSADELMGHGTIYAHLIVPPHCSLGFHQHVENTEPYYVLKGKGI